MTTIITPSLISTFRYGLTREGVQTTDVSPFVLRGPDQWLHQPALRDKYRELQHIPVHDIHEDLVWTKGAHKVMFGAEFLIIHNDYRTNANSFSVAQADGLYPAGDGDSLLLSDAKVSNTTIQNIATLNGDLTKNQLKLNYDLHGNTFPRGVIIPRTFKEQHYDMYVQDSWKLTRGLTVSAGLRLGLSGDYAVNGYNVDSRSRGNWLAARIGLAESGQSQSNAGLVSYNFSSTTGRKLYPYHTDWAPRVALPIPARDVLHRQVPLWRSRQDFDSRGLGYLLRCLRRRIGKGLSSAIGFSTAVQSGPASRSGCRHPALRASTSFPR